MYHLHPLRALREPRADPVYIRNLMASILGGGPLVFGPKDARVLALSGFFPQDAPAVNLLALTLYMAARGWLRLPQTAAAPLVAAGPHHVNPYFDFLSLKSEVARELTAFYHAARPVAVAVFLGGEDFEVVATTDAAAEALGLRRVSPPPYTPHGVASLKYSHGLEVRVPPRPHMFDLYAQQVADLLSRAALLPPIQHPVSRVAYRDILVLHGGRREGDVVEIDNVVHAYI